MRDIHQLALGKAEEYIQKQDIVAVALTGSIARNMTWQGSDIDLWVFRNGEEDFEDGRIEGIYWEADIKPASILDMEVTRETWLKPMPLNRAHERLFEALWGCDVLYDPTGKLGLLSKSIEEKMSDPRWLYERIQAFIMYGQGCLDGLADAEPLAAIVGARSVATDYGIVSYWMNRNKLLTSVCRIPENLSENEKIQALYKEIFGLTGQAGSEEFLANIKLLPQSIRDKIQNDVELEIIPVFEKGCYDGGVRHMRQGMARWFNAEEVKPILALEKDLEKQKERVLRQTRELLDLCEKP